MTLPLLPRLPPPGETGKTVGDLPPPESDTPLCVQSGKVKG